MKELKNKEINTVVKPHQSCLRNIDIETILHRQFEHNQNITQYHRKMLKYVSIIVISSILGAVNFLLWIIN